MRINIEIDDDLILNALQCVNVSSKRELIDLALREFSENHRRKDIRELRGKIKFRDDYHHKKLRKI